MYLGLENNNTKEQYNWAGESEMVPLYSIGSPLGIGRGDEKRISSYILKFCNFGTHTNLRLV